MQRTSRYHELQIDSHRLEESRLDKQHIGYDSMRPKPTYPQTCQKTIRKYTNMAKVSNSMNSYGVASVGE
eukprot:6481221-Amphidinium_carterae.1